VSVVGAGSHVTRGTYRSNVVWPMFPPGIQQVSREVRRGRSPGLWAPGVAEDTHRPACHMGDLESLRAMRHSTGGWFGRRTDGLLPCGEFPLETARHNRHLVSKPAEDRVAGTPGQPSQREKAWPAEQVESASWLVAVVHQESPAG
jgi:hypothetical protein